MNEHPDAISFLENNPDMIEWMFLSSNPKAIKILEKYYDRVNYETLSINSAIFV
jgi:hypothetical protein